MKRFRLVKHVQRCRQMVFVKYRITRANVIDRGVIQLRDLNISEIGKHTVVANYQFIIVNEIIPISFLRHFAYSKLFTFFRLSLEMRDQIFERITYMPGILFVFKNAGFMIIFNLPEYAID